MISIVFITCNRKSELARAIISCLDKVDEGFEIIVVDNNSVDGSEECCRDLAKLYNFRLIYLVNAKNIGVASSRNIGFGLATGDIVYFLDDDARIVTTGKCISRVAEFMRRTPHYPIVTTEIFNVTNNYHQHGPLPIGSKVNTENEVLYFIGASHFINKALLNGTKLYPSEFFYGGEEYYLSFYLRKSGFRIFYDKGMRVDHFPSTSTRLSSDEIMLSSYSNNFNVKRYFSPSVLLPVIYGVMFVRMTLKCINKPLLWKGFIAKINAGYNKGHRSPMKFSEFVNLIFLFGARTIL
jgi:glycosyltransferase involved in cell wall biosynthesis